MTQSASMDSSESQVRAWIPRDRWDAPVRGEQCPVCVEVLVDCQRLDNRWLSRGECKSRGPVLALGLHEPLGRSHGADRLLHLGITGRATTSYQ
jgi:hypothetical protein